MSSVSNKNAIRLNAIVMLIDFKSAVSKWLVFSEIQSSLLTSHLKDEAFQYDK